MPLFVVVWASPDAEPNTYAVDDGYWKEQGSRDKEPPVVIGEAGVYVLEPSCRTGEAQNQGKKPSHLDTSLRGWWVRLSRGSRESGRLDRAGPACVFVG